MDEQHLYHREALNDWDYSEDDWAETDDAQFAYVSDFDDSETASPILPDDSLYLVGGNIFKQPEKEGNTSQDLEQDMTIIDDLESELSEPPEEMFFETNSGSIESSRQSGRAEAPRKLYPGQITYGSASISKKLLDNPSQSSLNTASLDTLSSLPQFTSTWTAQSNVHMVQTLRMLDSNIDNKGDDDEPNTLKQVMRRPYWLKWRETIQAEYDSLIENKTWELTAMPEN